MNKRGIAAAAVALSFAGAANANAQGAPGGAGAGQAPGYAVEGLTLGSKVKSDGAAYREYKCSPSEQFNGFTWCQKTRRDSERRGSFEANFSILHAKDGTIVYVNRNQQPAFFDASEADRDIQNYARKFGASPGLTRMPRRSGSTDAVLATWGNVELEPLDSDSVKVLADGKSPRKGLLIDFLGDFARSAREGLPIYRIVGGAGFVWAGSYDQKGRGALRFAAVDASALQPAPVTAPPPAAVAAPSPAAVAAPSTAAVTAQPPAPVAAPSPAPLAAQPPAPVVARPPTPPLAPVAAQPPPEPPRKPELAAGTTATRDAEATVARLQAELSAAAKEKRDAQQAAQAAQAAQATAAKAGRDGEATVARLQAELSTAQKEKRDAELAAQAAAAKAGRDGEATVARLQAELSTAQKERRDAEVAARAAAAKAGRDTETSIARLQAELSAALKQRREAEAAAQAARTDAEIARKEFEAATNDANAAKEEIDRLKAGLPAPETNLTGAVLIGIATTAILFFFIWAFASLRSAAPRASVHADKTDAVADGGEPAVVPSPLASEHSAGAEPRLDTADLVEQLAKTLGVEDLASPPAAPLDADGDQHAVTPQEHAHAGISGDEDSISSLTPSGGEVLLSAGEDDGELAKPLVPDSPGLGEEKEIHSDREGPVPQPEKAGTS